MKEREKQEEIYKQKQEHKKLCEQDNAYKEKKKEKLMVQT
jgi:hypothetical protein